MFVGTLAAKAGNGGDVRTALSVANQQAAKLVSTPECERGHLAGLGRKLRKEVHISRNRSQTWPHRSRAGS